MSNELKGQIYRGRFAPSPSGPLHFGSLVAALGSYLRARSRDGVWLVRMEDLDPPREMAGADTLILNSLEAHGLYWDEDVMYQSHRSEAYDQALNRLHEKELLFYCSCTSKQIRNQAAIADITASNFPNTDRCSIYPGTCRKHTAFRDNCSIRIRVNAQTIMFHDPGYGLVAQNLMEDVGDFIVKRKDGLYAYQLAVVTDDIAQNISEVVRGADLLDSTPRQLFLYQSLEASPPDYLHLPLALLPDRKKLSKQTGAKPLDDSNAKNNLLQAMNFLGMKTPADLSSEPVEAIIQWGIDNWNISNLPSHDIVI